MSIIALILILSFIGFAMYLVNTQIPMQPQIKNLINIIVIFVVLFWLLNIFGITHTSTDLRL
jgi:hypothetical protein